MKKLYKIAKAIITIVLLLILAVIIVQRVSSNNLTIGGFRVFTIISESMEPDYLVGDILVSREIPANEIEVGDRVTYLGRFGDMTGLVVTHEVIEKRSENNEYFFITQGIANDLPDPEISGDDIYGKIIYRTTIFSFFGRLMTNLILYYLFFVIIGIYFSYQVITAFIIKKENEVKDEHLASPEEGS